MAVERGKCKEKYTKKSKSPACFEGFPLSLSKFAISFWNKSQPFLKKQESGIS